MSRDGRLHRLDPPEALKRGTGSPELFGIVQGLLSASMYFVLGVVVVNALGYSWLVYLVASLFFVLLVLSYMEGASLHQERGGATIIARYGFNELWSFVAGWAILLDYLILIAITAFATTDYAAVFWDQLAHGAPELILAIGVIAYVAFVNFRGLGSKRWIARGVRRGRGRGRPADHRAARPRDPLRAGRARPSRPASRAPRRWRTACSPSRSPSPRSRGSTPRPRWRARSRSRARGCGGCSPSACPPRWCPTSASAWSPRPRCRRPAGSGRRPRWWGSSPRSTRRGCASRCATWWRSAPSPCW